MGIDFRFKTATTHILNVNIHWRDATENTKKIKLWEHFLIKALKK